MAVLDGFYWDASLPHRWKFLLFRSKEDCDLEYPELKEDLNYRAAEY